MDVPDIIPPVELKGSRTDKVQTLDVAIARLEKSRSTFPGQPIPGTTPSDELYGRYINAPVWPWLAAGWVVGALFVVLFVVAWSYS